MKNVKKITLLTLFILFFNGCIIGKGGNSISGDGGDGVKKTEETHYYD